LYTYCYDQVLEEPLEPHECLVDFLAVSGVSRGRGVGQALMRWAESTATDILSKREPQFVATNGVLMTLWVAAENVSACRLYQKLGYKVVKRTNDSRLSCLFSQILQRMLGHPVWWKMSKRLLPPINVFASTCPGAQYLQMTAPVPVLVQLMTADSEAEPEPQATLSDIPCVPIVKAQ
jgi:hypothetical protein